MPLIRCLSLIFALCAVPMLLSAEPDIEVVFDAATGRTAVELVRRHRPDVVLMPVTPMSCAAVWSTT